MTIFLSMCILIFLLETGFAIAKSYELDEYGYFKGSWRWLLEVTLLIGTVVILLWR